MVYKHEERINSNAKTIEDLNISKNQRCWIVFEEILKIVIVYELGLKHKKNTIDLLEKMLKLRMIIINKTSNKQILIFFSIINTYSFVKIVKKMF